MYFQCINKHKDIQIKCFIKRKRCCILSIVPLFIDMDYYDGRNISLMLAQPPSALPSSAGNLQELKSVINCFVLEYPNFQSLSMELQANQIRLLRLDYGPVGVFCHVLCRCSGLTGQRQKKSLFRAYLSIVCR